MRFFEFTGDYHCANIKTVSIFVKDGTHGTHQNVENGVPLLSAKDIANGIINIDVDSRRISFKDYKKIFKRITPTKNDVLITIVGTVGRTAIIPDNFPIFAFQRSVGWIRPTNAIHPEYFDFVLQSKSVQQRIQKEVNASAQGGIYLEKLSSIKIDVPSLEEQIKVSCFLKLINERINTQNKIIEEYEALRKSILDLLICNSLEQGKSKIGKIIKEYNVKTIADNEYPVLSSTASGIYYQSDYFNKEAASEDTTGYKCVPKGYCTYRSMSDTGRFYFNIQTITDVGIVSPAYPVFQVIEDSSLFFISVINNDKNMLNQILKLKAGGTRFSLPFKKLIQLDIPWPDYQTRHYFQKIIRAFDKRIDLEKSLLAKYLKQKNYLLDNLFI